jgi:hypothetical protein
MSSHQVFDRVRNLWVAATPEEIVRQKLLIQMIDHLDYPQNLLAVEKDLRQLPHLSLDPHLPDRRADILSFYKDASQSLSPLLLIECKEVELDQHALDQLLGYNYFVKAPFIAMANPNEVKFGFYESRSKAYEFLNGLPSYSQLVKLVSHASVRD